MNQPQQFPLNSLEVSNNNQEYCELQSNIDENTRDFNYIDEIQNNQRCNLSYGNNVFNRSDSNQGSQFHLHLQKVQNNYQFIQSSVSQEQLDYNFNNIVAQIHSLNDQSYNTFQNVQSVINNINQEQNNMRQQCVNIQNEFKQQSEKQSSQLAQLEQQEQKIQILKDNSSQQLEVHKQTQQQFLSNLEIYINQKVQNDEKNIEQLKIQFENQIRQLEGKINLLNSEKRENYKNTKNNLIETSTQTENQQLTFDQESIKNLDLKFTSMIQKIQQMEDFKLINQKQNIIQQQHQEKYVNKFQEKQEKKIDLLSQQIQILQQKQSLQFDQQLINCQQFKTLFIKQQEQLTSIVNSTQKISDKIVNSNTASKKKLLQIQNQKLVSPKRQNSSTLNIDSSNLKNTSNQLETNKNQRFQMDKQQIKQNSKNSSYISNNHNKSQLIQTKYTPRYEKLCNDHILINTNSDGNCFYSALQYCLNQNDLNLRQKIGNYYKSNMNYYQDFIPKENQSELLKQIYQNGAFATYPVLKIAADCLRRPIALYRYYFNEKQKPELFYPYKNKKQTSQQNNTEPQWLKILFTGDIDHGHFDALITGEELSKRKVTTSSYEQFNNTINITSLSTTNKKLKEEEEKKINSQFQTQVVPSSNSCNDSFTISQLSPLSNNHISSQEFDLLSENQINIQQLTQSYNQLITKLKQTKDLLQTNNLQKSEVKGESIVNVNEQTKTQQYKENSNRKQPNNKLSSPKKQLIISDTNQDENQTYFCICPSQKGSAFSNLGSYIAHLYKKHKGKAPQGASHQRNGERLNLIKQPENEFSKTEDKLTSQKVSPNNSKRFLKGKSTNGSNQLTQNKNEH